MGKMALPALVSVWLVPDQCARTNLLRIAWISSRQFRGEDLLGAIRGKPYPNCLLRPFFCKLEPITNLMAVQASLPPPFRMNAIQLLKGKLLPVCDKRGKAILPQTLKDRLKTGQRACNKRDGPFRRKEIPALICKP